MTTQTGDRLITPEGSFSVKPFPLRERFGADGHDAYERFCDQFTANSTACYRGYVATWSIIYGHLWLTAFKAKSKDRTDMDIVDVFGVERLAADWFTGELKCSEGEVIWGVFEPICERDRVWQFDRGILIDHFVKTNEKPSKPDPRGCDLI
jgi:hypothetical protein